jgi:transcriptional regulator with PAS, ATPase and Fis domain
VIPVTSAPLSLPRLLQDFPALAESLRGIERAAATGAPVLLLGEPGSGRSTVARAVHGASPRAAGPLVEVDPGAIPSTLFESEFFG